MLVAAAQAQDFLPEPDITYVGNVPAGSQVAITHPAGMLDSVSAGSGSYVLVVRLVQPVADPAPANPPAGSAVVGDLATVLVDGIAQGRVTLQERGAIYRLDIPNPVTVPAPDTLLNPVRVVPSIPTAAPTPTGPTPTRTRTPTAGTPGASATPTPTATFALSGCVGDCDGSGQVAVNELIRGVNIALEKATLDLCPTFDANDNGLVSINELVIAVRNALNGCTEGM
jgi:hypothetical protein